MLFILKTFLIKEIMSTALYCDLDELFLFFDYALMRAHLKDLKRNIPRFNIVNIF